MRTNAGVYRIGPDGRYYDTCVIGAGPAGPGQRGRHLSGAGFVDVDERPEATGLRGQGPDHCGRLHLTIP